MMRKVIPYYASFFFHIFYENPYHSFTNDSLNIGALKQVYMPHRILTLQRHNVSTAFANALIHCGELSSFVKRM